MFDAGSRKLGMQAVAVLAVVLAVFAAFVVESTEESDAAITPIDIQLDPGESFSKLDIFYTDYFINEADCSNIPSWVTYWEYSDSHGTNQGVRIDGTAPSTSGKYTMTWTATDVWGSHDDTVVVTITVGTPTVNVTNVTISGSTSGEVGDTITLTASVTPSNATNKNVSWSITSGSSYASISPSGSTCRVYLEDSGTVTIRATAQDGSGKSDTHTIDISDILVSSITIRGSSDVMVGDSERYTVTVSPSNAGNKGITWSLSNDRATITSQTDTSCNVRFDEAGSVTLYADAEDDSGEYDSFTIYITDPVVLVTNVTITGSTSVDVGNSITLNVSVDPSDATDDSIYWEITSGSQYAEITRQTDTSCTIEGLSSGTVTVRASAEDDSGEYDTHTITVTKPIQQFKLVFDYSPSDMGPQGGSWSVRQDTYSYIIPATIPMRDDGFTFVNWSGSDGKTYSPGQQIILQPGTTTLTATWEQSEFIYYLHYSASGASNVPPTDDWTGSTDGSHTFTVSQQVPTKAGSVFLHWTCDGLEYDPGDSIGVTYGSPKTLTAVWDDAQLEITSVQNSVGMTVSDTFTYTVTASHTGCTVSVSGADWLSVSGNTVSGKPTSTGSYDITVTIHKDGGYIDDTQSFTITVYSNTGFVSQPSADGFYTYMLD